MRRSTALLIVLVASCRWTCLALASEESERLIARAEVAYHGGRYDEARALFAEAATADPTDPAAPYGLGLANGRLGQWGTARTNFEQALKLLPDFPKARQALAIAATHQNPDTAPGTELDGGGRRWQLRAGTGIQYDSNPTLDPNHRREDAVFVFSAGGRVDLLRRAGALVRLDYDLYQSLHADEQAFDLRSHRFALSASAQLATAIWAGVQVGYDHHSLADRAYLQEPWVTPFMTVLEPDVGLSQVWYRHSEQDFLGSPFGVSRDGPSDGVGLNQVFYLGDPNRHLQLGYEYGEDTPHKAAGDDWARRWHEGSIGVELPAWCETTVAVGYAYRYDDYTEANSFDVRGRQRSDGTHLIHAAVSRAITDHFRAELGYYGTIDGSNIGLFDYRRHIVGLTLQATY